MTSKKGKFQSLSDAGDMLKKLGRQLSGTSANAKKAIPEPKQNGARGQSDSFEQEMLHKAASRQDSAKPNGKPRKGQKAHKKGENKNKQIRLPGTAGVMREIRAAEDAVKAAKAAEAAAKSNGAMLEGRKQKQETFARIKGVIARSSPAIEVRPASVSAHTRRACETAIERGARSYPDASYQDEDGIIIGFDFGTSSLKLAVRQPYSAGDPVVAMPVPEDLQSGSHPYLFQTAIWFEPETQRFSLFPLPGYEVLEGFKTGIIGGHGSDRVRADLPVTRSEAAIAFVTLHLAHCLGWYLDKRPLGAGASERILSINVGIPVAHHDDVQFFSRFRRIIASAHALVALADMLTLGDVRDVFQKSSDALPQIFQLVPELTAAIAGYAAAPTAQSGPHMLVDVGASTLDIVAFNLVRGELVAVFSAAVELLGSASLETARKAGILDKEFKDACDYVFDQVYGEAKSPSRYQKGFSPTYRRKPVQLVTTGGGCHTELHSTFVEQMPKEGVLGAVPMIHPEPVAHLTNVDCDSARLLLAFGLTRDVQELLDLKLPSQVPSISPDDPSGPTFISKDMT